MSLKDSRSDRSGREQVTAIAERALKGERIAALAIYGSHVAGYARPDSDYDVIVVLENYGPKIQYRYLNGEIEVSALLVDRKSLELDAEKAALGEFVVGRLLNIYEPLIGETLLEEIENRYKVRVAKETIYEIIATYREFSRHLLIPFEYFLFEKLRKRASMYPPAYYSYSKTYSGAARETNLASTLSGFRKALRKLEEEELVRIVDGSIGLTSKVLARSTRSRLAALADDTARAVASYAIHGYAGRASLHAVRKEALSKIRRSSDIKEVPKEIKHPKSLWNIDEGKLVVETYDWLRDTLSMLGLEGNSRVMQRHLGEAYNTAKAYFVKLDGKELAFTAKNFKDPWSVKWAFLNIWALPSKSFKIGSLARLDREYWAHKTLREMGFNTPKVIAIFLNDGIFVSEYVRGQSLSSIVSGFIEGKSDELDPVREYGGILGAIHAGGIALGDTKPSNTIVVDDLIYLTDLEQASEGGDRAWDVAEFLYYSSKLILHPQRVKKLEEAFLNGYLESGSPRTLKEALNVRYLAPFQPFMSPLVVRAIRKGLDASAR